MGDPSPDLKAVSEELIKEGLAEKGPGDLVELRPPRSRPIEEIRRWARTKAAYNASVNKSRAEYRQAVRFAEIEIKKEDLRF